MTRSQLLTKEVPPTREEGAAAPFTPVPASPAESPLAAVRKAHAIPALDGVRAIAASLVFLVHFQAAFGYLLGAPAGAASRFGEYLAAMGYNGVNVFFVLSGFLIYGSLLGRPTPFMKFFKRRVRRIYPTYWVVLALYVALSLTVAASRSRLPVTGKPLYLLANVLLLPGVFPITPIVTVSWSLSYEIVFYLALAFAVTVLALRKWRRAARVTMLAALLVAWVLSGLAVRAAVGSFVMFVPGLLLYELRDAWPKTFRAPAAIALGIAAAVAAAIVIAPTITLALESGRWAGAPTTAAVVQAGAFLLLSAGTSLLIFAAVATDGWLARALSWSPVRTVGLVSYSFYLIHGATINLFALLFTRLFGRASLGLGWYLVLIVPAYAACVGTSLLLFRTVERRFSF